MDEYEVIYIDDDERNAVTRERRPSFDYSRPRTDRSRIIVPASRRPTIIRQPVSASTPVSDRRPAQVVVHQPAPRPILGGFSTGELVELAAQLLAAIQPLPGAPAAQGHVETDVENLVIYQTALATHAKKDEQLRTLGNLVGRLLK